MTYQPTLPTSSLAAPGARRHPEWIRVRVPSGDNYLRLKSLVHRLALHSVCEEALCPNIGECWNAGTATFMILGDTCTRACRFCGVKAGRPRGVVDNEEPSRVAEAVAQLNLNYVVITSVDRDDLPDGGAELFAETVREIKVKLPYMIVEVLTPDFRAAQSSIERVMEAKPDVFGHNIETVRRLSPVVRDPRAGYEQSLDVFRIIKQIDPLCRTKSAILVGMGESTREVVETMSDLRSAGVTLLSIGQYLPPTASKRHYPISQYVHPDLFAEYRQAALRLGFQFVASGPLVRSSYRAWER